MAARRLTDAEILAQIPAARARAARESRTKPHAASARYMRASRMLRVRLTNGAEVSIPVALLPNLAGASDASLAQVTVGPFGMWLAWERLNMDLSGEGLARIAFGSAVLMKAAGSEGGRSTSKRKAAAARENGKKGGRPAHAKSTTVKRTARVARP